ncbi:hypothetical protein TWF696_004371 [Orbilia brochopaga]|uniref:Uncharacterized protein n=1 Tax=Orbilia brochopaga TaxID=3140254 RepID=A0AAV9V5X1_9PEZI
MSRPVNLMIFILSLWNAATAAPAPVDVTTAQGVDYTKLLVPGPGLPSVQELGLTNADLLKPLPGVETPSTRSLSKRFDLRCSTDTFQWCNGEDAKACYNYLKNLGKTICSVSGGDGASISMCHVGPGIGCDWRGVTWGVSSAASYCEDVAAGGLTIIQKCSLEHGVVAGENAANGNGNLIVTID